MMCVYSTGTYSVSLRVISCNNLDNNWIPNEHTSNSRSMTSLFKIQGSIRTHILCYMPTAQNLWPLLLGWINFNPSNHTLSKVLDEITYPFPNVNGAISIEKTFLNIVVWIMIHRTVNYTCDKKINIRLQVLICIQFVTTVFVKHSIVYLSAYSESMFQLVKRVIEE